MIRKLFEVLRAAFWGPCKIFARLAGRQTPSLPPYHMKESTRIKAELRRYGTEQLNSLPPAFVRECSKKVMDNLKAVPEFAKAKKILTCLSFGNEVDTWPLVNELASEERREVYVVRADRHDQQLHVHPYPCRLQTLSMGLKQPTPGEPEIPPDRANFTIEVALVLGILFDRTRGFRLGHGKGYFDRFLADKTFFTIGLAFERQLVESFPAEPHDVPLRMIVTESSVYRFD